MLLEGLEELMIANNEVDETAEYKSCYIHITQNCNLKCPYCYSKDDLRNHSIDYSFEQWKPALEKIRTMGFHRLVFSGGEPLIHKEIGEILNYCNELGFEEIDLITNGTLINDNNIKFLKKYLTNLCVSLDGCDEESNASTRGNGSFGKTINNIALLRKNKVPVNIIATIYKENIEHINDYIALASSLDCTVSFSLFTVSGEATNNKQLQQTETQLSGLSDYLLDEETPQLLFDNIPIVKGIQYREGCGAGKYLISINADGKVYPCHFMMQDTLLMGNIFNDDMEDLLNAGYSHSSYMNVDNIEECVHCEYKNFCGGGCRANTYKGKDNICLSDDCQFYKTYYDKILAGFM